MSLSALVACTAGKEPTTSKKSGSYAQNISLLQTPAPDPTPAPDQNANFQTMMGSAAMVPGYSSYQTAGKTYVVAVRDIAYGPDDIQKLDLYYPSNATSKVNMNSGIGLPTIVFIHGGGWGYYDPSLNSGPDNKNGGGSCKGQYADPNCQCRANVFSKAGFAVACIDFHGTMDSPASQFPQQIWDVKAAIRYLRAHAADLGLDSNAFIAMGVAAGGELATLAGTTAGSRYHEGDLGDSSLDAANNPVSSAVSAVIDISGFTDLSLPTHSVAVAAINAYLGGTVSSQSDRALNANPINFVDANDPPMLIFHGQDESTMASTDVNKASITIPYASSKNLVNALANVQKSKAQPACSYNTSGSIINGYSCMFMLNGVYRADDVAFWSSESYALYSAMQAKGSALTTAEVLAIQAQSYSLDLMLNFIRGRVATKISIPIRMP